MFAVEDAIVDGHPFWSDLFLIFAVVLFLIGTVLAGGYPVAHPTERQRSPWLHPLVFVALGLACTAFAWLLL